MDEKQEKQHPVSPHCSHLSSPALDFVIMTNATRKQTGISALYGTKHFCTYLGVDLPFNVPRTDLFLYHDYVYDIVCPKEFSTVCWEVLRFRFRRVTPWNSSLPMCPGSRVTGEMGGTKMTSSLPGKNMELT